MIATGNAAAREWARKNPQPTVTAVRPDAADLGEMDPLGRGQGQGLTYDRPAFVASMTAVSWLWAQL
jgi:hypothetical protein